MKKTVIAIWGWAKDGKSDTIRRIAIEILRQFPDAIGSLSHDKIIGDIEMTIRIGKITIAIVSQGDPLTGLGKKLILNAKNNCEIIICATRTRGKTIKDVDKLLKSEYGYEIIWATNYRNYEKSEKARNDLNQFSAKQIVDLIKSIINDKLWS